MIIFSNIKYKYYIIVADKLSIESIKVASNKLIKVALEVGKLFVAL